MGFVKRKTQKIPRMRKFSHPGDCLVGNGGKAWLTGQNHGVVCQHFAEFFFRESNTTSLIMLGSWTRIFTVRRPAAAKTGCRTRRPGFGRLVRPEGRGGGDKIVVDHSSAGEIMLNDRRDLALGLFGLVLKMQVGKVSSSHKVFLSVSLPPSARQTPPKRGEMALAPEGEQWPRRAEERAVSLSEASASAKLSPYACGRSPSQRGQGECHSGSCGLSSGAAGSSAAFRQGAWQSVVGQQLLQLVAQAVLHTAQLRHFVALIPDLQVRGGDRSPKTMRTLQKRCSLPSLVP